VVVAPRSVLGAVVTVAAAVALAWAVSGKGCGESDASPEGAARAFVAAARAEDKAALWELLGPATRARVSAAAAAATDKVGGARRFAPLDVLDVAAPESTYVPSDIVVRETHGATAVVDVLGPEGRRDSLRMVAVGGKWRVEIEF
jgi:hypothetical protein